MKTLKELQPLIIEWATERNIHLLECNPKQRLKLIEETGELCSAILKNKVDEQKDAIGDIFVVLIILAEQQKENVILDLHELTDESYLEFHDLFHYLLCKNYDLQYSVAYLNDIATKLNLDLTECCNLAWNEIKNRKGKTINGTFIKN